jgi:hypothetical protein
MDLFIKRKNAYFPFDTNCIIFDSRVVHMFSKYVISILSIRDHLTIQLISLSQLSDASGPPWDHT